MKEYQRKKNNPYVLPHEVYMQCLWSVRDYRRQMERYSEVLHSSPAPPDGMPRSTDTTDPTAQKAEELACILRFCEDVEQALRRIPREYREAIIENIATGCGYPLDAHRNTYSTWRGRFLFHLAKNKRLI